MSANLTGVVDDRYAIERELGRGGMSTVYLARDLRHGSKVAIKVLSPALVNALGGKRFTREIRITAGLQHPNILPVFDSGEVDGLPYYVMPYVDGPTLSQRLAAEGQLPVAEALEIAAEVASALRHAHAEGYVHRDIKPSNILLAHGHAVVADFGVARTMDAIDGAITGPGVALGTAAYMSPEQAVGAIVDGRSDIYSVGCVLYQMVAGQPPFAASSRHALMARHVSDPVPDIRSIRPSVSEQVGALIHKALEKNPADRFANADELREAIRDIETQEAMAARADIPVELLPPPPPVKGSRWRARNVAILSVAIIAAAGATWQIFSPAEEILDRNRVMVYPIVVPPDFDAPRTIGEDVATMIGSAIDGSGPLRWIDGWPLLEPATRRDIRTLAAADARALARAKRCAYYLMGRVLARGDSSEIILTLTDVAGDSAVARARAVGATGDTWRTGLRAVNGILAVLIPSGNHDVLREWNDRDPGAIASFLLGESAFRRVQLTEALSHYRAAVKSDSTFSLAAIRGAQAATWNHRSAEAVSFIQVALRQRMSPRYTRFANGYQAYLDGAPDSAAREFGRAIRLDPEMSVAWMQLGEVYTHLLPNEGDPDSLARAAFDEAHRLDPLARNLLLHPIEIRLRAGEVGAAEELVRAFLAADADSTLAHQVRIMYDCVRAGIGAVDWPREAREQPLALLAASNSLKGGGARLSCALEGYKAVAAVDSSPNAPRSGRGYNAIMGTGHVLLAQRRFDEARSRIDGAITRGWGGAAFYLMAGPFVPELRNFARIVAQQDEISFGPNYSRATYSPRLWQLGVWEAYAGRPAVAAAVARELRHRARASGSVSDARLAKSMEAHARLAAGDTVAAIQMLDAILSEPVPGGDLVWDAAAPRGPERLVLARLLSARGDHRRAIWVANVFDSAWPSVYLLYLPASLELRASAATALADADGAAGFRSRLAALRGEKVVAGQ